MTSLILVSIDILRFAFNKQEYEELKGFIHAGVIDRNITKTP